MDCGNGNKAYASLCLVLVVIQATDCTEDTDPSGSDGSCCGCETACVLNHLSFGTGYDEFS